MIYSLRFLMLPMRHPLGFHNLWNFILIKANEIRQQVKDSFVRKRDKSISMLDSDKTKQKRYLSPKLEGILDSAINICVTYDPTRFGPFVLGRTSIAETGVYSVCCAIQNLWLAARVEGIGIGWVSILTNEDNRESCQFRILLDLWHTCV
ncbi:MAG: nitroreductase family protein [Candidatus Nitrosopolaris sp.]